MFIDPRSTAASDVRQEYGQRLRRQTIGEGKVRAELVFERNSCGGRPALPAVVSHKVSHSRDVDSELPCSGPRTGRRHMRLFRQEFWGAAEELTPLRYAFGLALRSSVALKSNNNKETKPLFLLTFP